MIFGTQIPKIQSTISSSVSMSLYDSELDPTFLDPNVLEQKSIVTGMRNYIPFGDYAEFDVVINIFKGNTDFETLKKWDKQEVYFYPHRDGNVIKDKYNEPLKFTIQSIEPYYLTQDERYDVAILKLKSKDFAQYIPIPAGGYGSNYGMYYGIGL
jgi:hypothetical protein